MQTRRTTTRENQWGDNEEEEVSKAPEGPALGYYYSNGPAWTAGAARWRSILHSFFFFFGPERVHVTGFNLFTFWGQQAGPLLLLDSIEFWAWSGPWCHQARNSSRDLNICRLSAVFLTALPAGAGLDAFTDMSGSTPAGRPALLWWIWWSWIDSSILHRSSTRSPFPWIDQKRMGVCMNMDVAWLACAWGGGIFSHLLYHCKRITHRSQRE